MRSEELKSILDAQERFGYLDYLEGPEKGNEIDYETRTFVYNKAITKYGIKPQMLMVIEEMSELTKEICKFFRKPNDINIVDAIAEETADVTIMLEQLRIMLNINESVCEYMDYKVERLAKRVSENT